MIFQLIASIEHVRWFFSKCRYWKIEINLLDLNHYDNLHVINAWWIEKLLQKGLYILSLALSPTYSFFLFRCKKNSLHNIRIFLNVKFYVNNSFKKRIYLNVRVAFKEIIKSHIIISLPIKSILNILINLILMEIFKK